MNLETWDTHAEAALAAKIAGEIVEALASCENVDMEIERVIKNGHQKFGALW